VKCPHQAETLLAANVRDLPVHMSVHVIVQIVTPFLSFVTGKLRFSEDQNRLARYCLRMDPVV